MVTIREFKEQFVEALAKECFKQGKVFPASKSDEIAMSVLEDFIKNIENNNLDLIDIDSKERFEDFESESDASVFVKGMKD